MAGLWIKWVKGLAGKREVLTMANLLEMDRFEVAGRLMALWEWCDDNISGADCNAECNADVTLGVTPKYNIDALAGVTGFADAMEIAGWLRVTGTVVTFPNFFRHNGETAKQRALTANRVAELRRKRNAKRNADVTPPPLRLPLPEKRREDKNTGETPLPPSLDSPEFLAAWSDWRKHRTELRKPLRPTSEAKLLARLAAWGQARAIAAIEHTIAMGWQGIREPDPVRNGKAPQTESVRDELQRILDEEAAGLREPPALARKP